jgi:hypothetical protein
VEPQRLDQRLHIGAARVREQPGRLVQQELDEAAALEHRVLDVGRLEDRRVQVRHVGDAEVAVVMIDVGAELGDGRRQGAGGGLRAQALCMDDVEDGDAVLLLTALVQHLDGHFTEAGHPDALVRQQRQVGHDQHRRPHLILEGGDAVLERRGVHRLRVLADRDDVADGAAVGVEQVEAGVEQADLAGRHQLLADRRERAVRLDARRREGFVLDVEVLRRHVGLRGVLEAQLRARRTAEHVVELRQRADAHGCHQYRAAADVGPLRVPDERRDRRLETDGGGRKRRQLGHVDAWSFSVSQHA